MTLLLTPEQAMLKATAHTFFSQQQPVQALRALRDTADPTGFERALWQDMAALGWAGILIDEAHGGSDFGYQGLGQILEEAGRTLAATPLVSTVLLAAPLVRAAGSAALRSALLPTVVDGTRVLALALEEGPHHAPTRTALKATPEAGGFVLNGSKTYVLDGHIADDFIVLARTAGQLGDGHGLTLFYLRGDTEGLTRNRLRMVDSRNAAQLHLRDVRVAASDRLGELDLALAHLDPVLDGARAGLAAEMLGSALEAFERTLAYLKIREQFGVPIGSFQALKHRAAMMFCELELTRSAVRAALAALDVGSSEAALLACLAKAKACDTFELVSSEAVQLHGGIGMTDAAEIGLFLKRARVAQQLLGDAGFQRERYASLRGF
jgi:alkylation response protein AidB-like acyl-CoA dehydrogenase